MLNLHLGCGPILLPNFTNVDRDAHHNPDVCMDYLQMTERFGENSADLIYSCHSIEHLEYPAGVVTFFREAFRTLKPGGTLRLCVPDLRLVAAKYLRGESLKDIYNFNAYAYKDCPAERFTFFCRAWEHTVLFDSQLLQMLVQDAGFVQFHVCDFGASQHPAMRHIDRMEPESIVVQCYKPIA